MQARTLVRTLLVSCAVAATTSAVAQASDKEAAPGTTSKQTTTKSSPAKSATKRLDFSPSSNVKETATRPAAPGANTQTPARDGWHCDHSGASDA